MQQLCILLSLGSNLGDRLGYLQAAVNALKQFPDSYITATSAVYESPPWGIDGTPTYLNAALLFTIDISKFNIYSVVNNRLDDTVNNMVNINTDNIKNILIEKLLNNLLLYCQLIEKKYHRVRVKNKQYAARTLDIDILYAELSSDYYRNDICQSKTVITDNQYLDNINNIVINTKHLIIPHTQFAVRAFVLKPALDIWYSQTSRNRLLDWYNQSNVQIDEKRIIKIKSVIYL